MTATRPTGGMRPTTEAIVRIDQDQALILARTTEGEDALDVLARDPSETEAVFDGRILDGVIDMDRVIVSGTLDARTAFERAYVGVTHRPDRLIDIGPAAARDRLVRRPS
jgi:hypothetical protein